MSIRFLVEIAPVILVVLGAFGLRSVPAGLWSIPTRVLRWFAPAGGRAIMASALITLALSMVLSWARPPRPNVHDEFAYLLAADTFAHGRLSNPTHPMWEHFESFHIIQKPSYQSKYPPVQGLWMAAGQLSTGRPIAGVWLSMAAAAAAMCWMLLAWFPPRWALLGALIPVVRFGGVPFWDSIWFGYWSTTYWGGAAALLGGALLAGALPRLMRRARARDGAMAAAGLIVLANTRPYEGALVGLASGLVLACWLVTHRSEARAFAARAIPAGACVFGAGLLAMGFYNYRNTGDALRSPYMVYTETYQSVPLFIFRDLKPDKIYNHQAFRDFHESYMLTAYNKKREGFGLAETDFPDLFVFFLGFAMAPTLLFLPWRTWNHWHSFAVAVIGMVILSNKLVATMRLHFHYLAPAIPWLVFLVIAGLRRARALRLWGRRLGRAFAEALVVASVLGLLTGCVMHAVYLPRGVVQLSYHRPEVERQLLANAGNDLVIVRYSPDHAPHSEWVYNGADLDGAPIVWARDMGPENNRALLDYYSGRRAWVLYPDREPPELVPAERPLPVERP